MACNQQQELVAESNDAIADALNNIAKALNTTAPNTEPARCDIRQRLIGKIVMLDAQQQGIGEI